MTILKGHKNNNDSESPQEKWRFLRTPTINLITSENNRLNEHTRESRCTKMHLDPLLFPTATAEGSKHQDNKGTKQRTELRRYTQCNKQAENYAYSATQPRSTTKIYSTTYGTIHGMVRTDMEIARWYMV